MKLYIWGPAPNPRRVLLYLAEKGIEVPTEDVGEPGRPRLRASYLASSPHRLVPTLRLPDGTLLGEAMAICRYFEELYPDPPLFGRGPREIGLISMWERKVEVEGLRAASEALRNRSAAFAGVAVAGLDRPVEQIPALVARGQLRLERFYHALDQQLLGKRFIAGERFSVADVSAIVLTDFTRAAKVKVPPELPHLNRWMREVRERPAVKKVLGG